MFWATVFCRTSVLRIWFHFQGTVLILSRLEKQKQIVFITRFRYNALLSVTVNRPDEWANRAWKDWNAASLPVVNRSDWPIGAVDRFLVQLLTNTLEILVERPKVLRIVFMMAGGLKILNETLPRRTKLLEKNWLQLRLSMGKRHCTPSKGAV